MPRLTELAAFLKAHDDYAILGHVNPDGDTAGSCAALAKALQKLGKRAFVFLPGGKPQMFADFACTVEIVSGGELPFVPQTAFSVDVSDLARMGDGGEIFRACPATAMIDHHGTNPGFGDVWFVEGEAASCGELARELIAELGVALDVEMATWLYVAMCTDTGRFGFSSTRPQTMIAAADCLQAGIDVDFIHQVLYRTRSEGRTRLLGLALSGLEMDAGKQLCWTCLTPALFAQAGALKEDSDGIVNYLLEIRGVRCAILADERGACQTKFSLRSKPPFDVAAGVAVPLGGGGHAQAAGVTLNLPLEEALEKVLAQAKKALEIL